MLGTLVDGIEGGVFPALPGDYNLFFRTNENCRYCEFDSLCHRDRGDFAAAKRDAPQLRVLDDLVLRTDEGDDE